MVVIYSLEREPRPDRVVLFISEYMDYCDECILCELI